MRSQASHGGDDCNNSKASTSGRKLTFARFPYELEHSSRHSTVPIFVIQALVDYDCQAPNQLSFRSGEFFHVTGIYTDADGIPWFQAEDPVRGLRGQVRTESFRRYAPQRPPSVPIVQIQTLSRISLTPMKTCKAAFPMPKSRAAVSNKLHEKGLQRTENSKSWFLLSQCRTYYGVIKFEFVAERSDELSAQKGEPVVIIAQSAGEWFVVKPIGRLGGPGFIPCSYIEVKDVKTGNALSAEAVCTLFKTSIIPSVEDWKKEVMAYKACSITLGLFIDNEKMKSTLKPSLDSKKMKCPPSNQPGYRRPFLSLERLQRHAAKCLSTVIEDDDEGLTLEQKRKKYGMVHNVCAMSFHQEQGCFWFQLYARFRQPGSMLILYRLQEDFIALDIALQADFLDRHDFFPKLSNLTEPVDELVCSQRIEEFNVYLQHLCQLPESRRASEAIYDFLLLREGDSKIDDATTDCERSHPSISCAALGSFSSIVDMKLVRPSTPQQSNELSDDGHLANEAINC
ncbi:hypothetical protein O181_007414 [Austropuccinia psidii MF-1]|uniref:SH3 domain-containing protein n=1 Tax=Austropuccinia psidii MF-1 TaxID=1389203 RepID=A0A9Q3BKU7_9BASI|nr:hypothetical protein [Austropuccinia psidii MF-1]